MTHSMDCQTLAAHLQCLEPTADVGRVAELCLVISRQEGDLDTLSDPKRLNEAWRNAVLKLQLAADQQAAVADELEEMAKSDPEQFSPDQVWVLVRAIKVLSQTVQLYTGIPAMDV